MTKDLRKEDDIALTPSDLRRVLDALDASSWDEALITVGDVTTAVARNGGTLPGAATTPALGSVALPVSTEAPPAVAPALAAPNGATGPVEVVVSPTVGVFWRAAEPGAHPFVEVGQRVAPGDPLCIIEAMKLMSRVDAPVAGIVTEIHVENAVSVEHGSPPFTITLDEG